MAIYLPEPGSGRFDEYIQTISKKSGIDPLMVRLVLITIHQDSEIQQRKSRESEDRWKRGDIDI